jgi:hypothetical protein
VKRLLIIEDGDEYTEFARLFLGADLVIRQARSLAQTLRALSQEEIHALLIDLRFDRATPEALCGDLAATAAQLFGGDQARALRYLKDQQGALILAQVRAQGHAQPAVFIHDFPPRRLQNLQRL